MLAAEDPVWSAAPDAGRGDMGLSREGCPLTSEGPVFGLVVHMLWHMLEFCEGATLRARNYLHPTGSDYRLEGVGRGGEGLQVARP